MTDQFPQRRIDPRAARGQSHRVLAAAAVALAIVGGGVVWRVTAAEPVAPKREAVAPRNPQLDELLASTKALESSQQQAIDQLQALQDSVVEQQVDARRASDQVAALNGKLEALRQSFASAAQPAVADDKEAEAAPDKSREKTKATAVAASERTLKQSPARARHVGQRVGARKSRSVASQK